MLRQKWLEWFLIFLPTLAMALVARAQAQEAKTTPAPLPAAKEDPLGELPPQTRAPVDSNGRETQYNRFFLSPDLRRFAAIGKTEKKKWFVVIDGKVGPEFEEVRFKGGSFPGVSPVIFSPDSQHVAVVGKDSIERFSTQCNIVTF